MDKDTQASILGIYEDMGWMKQKVQIWTDNNVNAQFRSFIYSISHPNDYIPFTCYDPGILTFCCWIFANYLTMVWQI